MNKINYLNFPEEYRQRKSNYLKAFDRVMTKGVYVLGDEVKSFENEYAKYLGVKHSIGVANGLEALQISLMALGVDKGDEVITTPLSAVATTLAILAVGAIPVFVDIKEDGQINEEQIEKKISKRTKAIIPVHLYGQPAEIDQIGSICKKHGLFLIEDACQAHGTKFKNKLVGSFGDTACYSFYPTKNLGAIGDGGAIATNNSKLAKDLYQLRDYGQESKYKHVRYGINSRLDELQAAILIEKLKFLDNDNEKRRRIAERYNENLKNVNDLETVLPKKRDDSNFHLYVIKTKKRDNLEIYLKENGVSCNVHYPIIIPDQPMFKDTYKNTKLPVARRFVKEILSLPCHPFMRMEEVDYVCTIIKKFFK